MGNSDLLKYAIEHGMINMSYVQEQVEMNKRKELLNKHPYAIWEGKDGKWRTYLPDKSGRRMVKKSTQKDVENTIISYLQKKEYTFKYAYKQWRKTQDALISNNSIAKYNTDYKRYFENSDFENMEISSITEEDVKLFLATTVKRNSLCKKACKTLFGYLKNTFKSAMINGNIEDDPMKFLEVKFFYTYCIEKKRPKEKILFSDTEMSELVRMIEREISENSSYIPIYAVYLAVFTGMRVGEISAIKWEAVNGSYILIDKSEKYDRINKKYFVDATKNGKERIFPITPQINEIFEKVKKIEAKNGWMCEWVFSNGEGRIHAPVISSCLKNKCRQLGIQEKGIHALRRTLNSKMRCSGVSSTVSASLLGHTEQVNEQYYTFDVSSFDEKARIVSQVGEQIV